MRDLNNWSSCRARATPRTSPRSRDAVHLEVRSFGNHHLPRGGGCCYVNYTRGRNGAFLKDDWLVGVFLISFSFSRSRIVISISGGSRPDFCQTAGWYTVKRACLQVTERKSVAADFVKNQLFRLFYFIISSVLVFSLLWNFNAARANKYNKRNRYFCIIWQVFCTLHLFEGFEDWIASNKIFII